MSGISGKLQELILQNKAIYRTYNCYGSQFFALEIPKKHTIVITQIDWIPFINPPSDDFTTFSVNTLNLYSHYQLKIADFKTKYFLHFQNNIDLRNLPSGLTVIFGGTPFDTLLNQSIIHSAPKIIIPCFFVLQNEIRFVITRDLIEFYNMPIGLLSLNSKEELAPAGVKDTPIVLKVEDPPNNTLNYIPGIFPNNSTINKTPGIGNNASEYYTGVKLGDPSESFIPIQNIPTAFQHVSQPNFTVHYVLIKENLVGAIYGN